MDVKKLFKGVAVIIDDEINDNRASIKKILDQLDKEFIPCVKFDKLPDKEVVKSLQNASFILLDWILDVSLTQDNRDLGVRLPEEVTNSNISRNIEFLKEVQSNCFCPIFIFSNENVDNIKLTLQRARLYKSGSCNNILLRSKSDFEKDGSFYKALEDWLRDVAPIYLLKEWETAYLKSKSNLFIDFQKRSPNWAKILWNAYKSDNDNPCLELGDLISRSITTQMMPLPLDSSVFQNQEECKDSKELLHCLERQCYVHNDFLDGNAPEVGDVFKVNNDYYVNIRPSCDLISRDGTPIDDIDLYLLKPEILKKMEAIHSHYDEGRGNFKEGNVHCMIFPVCEGRLFHFMFKELYQKKWRDLKNNREGRLLPPFITKLQMKYSYYLQRQGFPKIPKEIFSNVPVQVEEIPCKTMSEDYSLKELWVLFLRCLKKIIIKYKIIV